MVGSYSLGPRIGRYETEFEESNDGAEEEKRRKEFRPHNVGMVVLGTFILWFGW